MRLVVTEVAVADEIAAAADLVKGKRPRRRWRWCQVRRVRRRLDIPATAGANDLFWLGTPAAPASPTVAQVRSPVCADPVPGDLVRLRWPSPRQPHITPGRRFVAADTRPSARLLIG